jgi:hypothetical protein
MRNKKSLVSQATRKTIFDRTSQTLGGPLKINKDLVLLI